MIKKNIAQLENKIISYLNQGLLEQARDMVIRLLDFKTKNAIPNNDVTNFFIRQVGLYQYLDHKKLTWQERILTENFAADLGQNTYKTLHQGQSIVLKKLLDGHNLAISAPTSFGKSFIIDAFIATKQPNNIVIIVPTLALTDETRRRLTSKFLDTYKIITTPNVDLSEKNILIFPQERAFQYIDKLKDIDLLIIDEFYKIDINMDPDRAFLLNKILIQLSPITKQVYLLAPNIEDVIISSEYQFIKNLEKLKLDFNTVALNEFPIFEDINESENPSAKKDALIQYLDSNSKNLVYVGSHPNLNMVQHFLKEEFSLSTSQLLLNAVLWLSENYGKDNFLQQIISRGLGVHSSQIPRSLGQIILKLFEEPIGIHTIISTSSIVEGINTSAENVFIWNSKKGKRNLDVFTYKNIAGRGGRMFKYFIGNLYLLDTPKHKNETVNITLEFPEDLLGIVDNEDLSLERSNTAKSLIEEFVSVLSDNRKDGFRIFNQLKKENVLNAKKGLEYYIGIAKKIRSKEYTNLHLINNFSTNAMYEIFTTINPIFPIRYGDFSRFIVIYKNNWGIPIPELIPKINQTLKTTKNLSLETFFMLEKAVEYDFTKALNDFFAIFNKIRPDQSIDITSLTSSASFLFLPPLVYLLEEHGLPRSISKKLQNANTIKLDTIENYNIHDTLDIFRNLGLDNLVAKTPKLSEFDKYILKYFYKGISLQDSIEP